ncbi:MAG: universal stress protein [Pseudomonadota bacterium]
MVKQRLSTRDGHRRKFLAIIDETPECERAVVYAARRADSTGGGLVLLYVIESSEFQHWLGVEQVMREEAMAEAQRRISKYSELARDTVNTVPEEVIREGTAVEQIHQLIEDDQEIAIMVLAASPSKDGPGPLVSSVAGRGAAFPIPVTVVPANLSDEDIACLA